MGAALIPAIISGVGALASAGGSILGGIGQQRAADDAADRLKKLGRQARRFQLPLTQQLFGLGLAPIPNDVSGTPMFDTLLSQQTNRIDEQFGQARNRIRDNLAARGLTGGSLTRALTDLEEGRASALTDAAAAADAAVRGQMQAERNAYLSAATAAPNPYALEASIVEGAPLGASAAGPFPAAAAGLQSLGRGAGGLASLLAFQDMIDQLERESEVDPSVRLALQAGQAGSTASSFAGDLFGGLGF